MKILSRRERVTNVSYSHRYDWRNSPGSGFSFDCDEHGHIDEAAMNPVALENLRKCQDGTYDVEDLGIRRYENSYVKPAVGECICGEEVVLHGFTNTCDHCERDYNMSGQLLAPREFWGEETGETPDDILSIP